MRDTITVRMPVIDPALLSIFDVFEQAIENNLHNLRSGNEEPKTNGPVAAEVLLSVPAICRLFSISESEVYILAKSGSIVAVKIAQGLSITMSSIRHFVENMLEQVEALKRRSPKSIS